MTINLSGETLCDERIEGPEYVIEGRRSVEKETLSGNKMVNAFGFIIGLYT